MNQSYKLSNGKVTEIEVNSAIVELLADFKREDENAARNERRRNEVSLDEMHEKGFEPTDNSIDIEADYITNEEKEILLAAVSHLSDKQRQLVNLRYYEEKTEYEIAAILGINQSNVHRQLETIHNALKKYFEKLL